MRCEHCGEPVRMLTPLTPKQRDILDYLVDYIGEWAVAPSFEEIGREFGYHSLATVHEHLGNLERKGWISKPFNETRGITVLAS
jgi:repressor LexA